MNRNLLAARVAELADSIQALLLLCSRHTDRTVTIEEIRPYAERAALLVRELSDRVKLR